jgi:uncharacterized protein (DUF779 family)
MIDRVLATDDTISLIQDLISNHGPVVFHQSGGCCDGSAPMCFPRNEFRVGSRDVFLGQIAEQPFFMSESQFEYWQHTQLIIDVIPGRGGMFSIEGPTGKRFLTRSRVFTDDEAEVLMATPPLRATDIEGFEGLRTTS